jgi:hypothetical protein
MRADQPCGRNAARGGFHLTDGDAGGTGVKSTSTQQDCDLERGKRQNPHQARAGATRAAEPCIQLRRRRPFAGECTGAPCRLTGPGALPGGRGDDTRTRRPPPVPGKGMSGRPGVHRPIAGGEIACTSPGAASTVRGRRQSQREAEQAEQAVPCLRQTAAHLVRPGTRHRSMARVRVPARRLWARISGSPTESIPPGGCRPAPLLRLAGPARPAVLYNTGDGGVMQRGAA